MKDKLIKAKNFIVDYLEEILVVIACISFIVCGFATDVRLGFLAITIAFLFLSYQVVKHKKLLNRK